MSNWADQIALESAPMNCIYDAGDQIATGESHI